MRRLRSLLHGAGISSGLLMDLDSWPRHGWKRRQRGRAAIQSNAARSIEATERVRFADARHRRASERRCVLVVR